eukprot:snap_masked-scaffold_39-processed-gene-1.52-mRNA-1 protein AED:1.00 eAED:1.00 QI:0/-1/0/0/-1/1/1/0/329
MFRIRKRHTKQEPENIKTSLGIYQEGKKDELNIWQSHKKFKQKIIPFDSWKAVEPNLKMKVSLQYLRKLEENDYIVLKEILSRMKFKEIQLFDIIPYEAVMDEIFSTVFSKNNSIELRLSFLREAKQNINIFKSLKKHGKISRLTLRNTNISSGCISLMNFLQEKGKALERFDLYLEKSVFSFFKTVFFADRLRNLTKLNIIQEHFGFKSASIFFAMRKTSLIETLNEFSVSAFEPADFDSFSMVFLLDFVHSLKKKCLIDIRIGSCKYPLAGLLFINSLFILQRKLQSESQFQFKTDEKQGLIKERFNQLKNLKQSMFLTFGYYAVVK